MGNLYIFKDIDKIGPYVYSVIILLKVHGPFFL